MVFFTKLRIVNNTKFQVDQIKVSETNKEDYVDPYRPENFNNITSIKENGNFAEKQLVVRSKKPCHVRMFLSFADDTFDDFEFNLSWALDMGYNLKLNKDRASHQLTFERAKQFSGNEAKDKTLYELILTVNHTKRQLMDMDAKELHEEGVKLLKNRSEEEALVKIEHARSLAQSKSLRDAIFDALKTTHETLGQKYFAKSLNIREKSGAYAEFLQNSLKHFENSIEFANNEDNLNLIKLIKTKMIVDEELYEISKLLEGTEEVVTLAELSRDDHDILDATDICEDILNKYEGVKQKLEECVAIDGRLEEELGIVIDEISNLTGYVSRLRAAQKEIESLE